MRPSSYACLVSACQDLPTLGTASPVLIAVAAGLLAGVAQLTKRHGVENAVKANELAHAALTLVVYSCATAIPVSALFLSMDPARRHRVLTDPGWQHRLPVTALGGLMMGTGAMLTIYAHAIRNHQMSCLIALVTGGVANVGSTIATLLVFQERPTLLQWLSISLMILGTVAIDFFRSQSRARDEDAGVPPAALVPGCSTLNTGCFEDQEKASPTPEITSTSWASLSIKLAAIAGMSYSFGNMSRVYGADKHLSAGLISKSDLVICSGFVMEVVSDLPPLFAFVWLSWNRGSEAKASADLGTSRSIRVIFGGLLVQCGCLLGTYALASAGENTKALTLLVEAGVASFAGPMYIAIAYKETPSCLQLLGAFLIFTAIMLAEVSARLKMH
eukprot:TRINITY_DN29109_c0_g1_i1.p1 TRINITY_DN29109_c0_g1~~TRINITY_DN29109_c0_g1_i1.p1  ORF type:complete len:388 (+),score=47.07 TRINITY_DN29109_c0_g1_i1:90-1253(+)